MAAFSEKQWIDTLGLGLGEIDAPSPETTILMSSDGWIDQNLSLKPR